MALGWSQDFLEKTAQCSPSMKSRCKGAQMQSKIKMRECSLALTKEAPANRHSDRGPCPASMEAEKECPEDTAECRKQRALNAMCLGMAKYTDASVRMFQNFQIAHASE